MRAAHGICGNGGYFVEIWAACARPAVGWEADACDFDIRAVAAIAGADGGDDGIALGMPKAHMAKGHGVFDVGAFLWRGGAAMREDDDGPRPVACCRVGQAGLEHMHGHGNFTRRPRAFDADGDDFCC